MRLYMRLLNSLNILNTYTVFSLLKSKTLYCLAYFVIHPNDKTHVTYLGWLQNDN